MALLLKDCGLEGFKGSVQRCAECRRPTVHFRRPGGWPVCGVCGRIHEEHDEHEEEHVRRVRMVSVQYAIERRQLRAALAVSR